MTDDNTKRDFRDRDRVARDEEYEVGYLASKFGLTIPEVRELIKKHGPACQSCVLNRKADRALSSTQANRSSRGRKAASLPVMSFTVFNSASCGDISGSTMRAPVIEIAPPRTTILRGFLGCKERQGGDVRPFF